MRCIMFPGQGSQKIGMGEDLFDIFPEEVTLANTILNYDIKELCLKDPNSNINNTEFTQPALFFVSALHTLKLKKTNEFNTDFVIGHSLGEYNALFAANVFSLETGLKLVQKRGKLMASATGGSMAAIVGLTQDQIKQILSKHTLLDIDIANFNEPKQTVISGPKQSIETAKEIFETEGARRYIQLAVSGAFHSRYMEQAKIEFSSFMDQFTFNNPQIPVIANINALPYDTTDSIKKGLSNQITGSVQWVQTIEYLIKQNTTEFTECGPGKVLAGLLNKIKLATAKTI